MLWARERPFGVLGFWGEASNLWGGKFSVSRREGSELRIERTIFWRDGGEKMGRMLIRGGRRGKHTLYYVGRQEKDKGIELFVLMGVLDPQLFMETVASQTWTHNHPHSTLNRVTFITRLGTVT